MNQDLFLYYLLQRVVEIQKSISITLPNSKILTAHFAHPRWWEPVANLPFPGFFNRAVRTGSVSQGVPIRKRTFRVTMRLMAGPAFAGYQGQYEDQGYMLYNAVLNRFDTELKLAAPLDPPHNLPLQYVETAIISQADNGFTGIAMDDNPQNAYICCDIPLDVTANFQLFRNS